MRIIFTLVLSFILFFTTKAKDTTITSHSSRHIAFIIGLPFQNFALPFRDLGSNFNHPGIFIGTELGLNKKKNLVQQLHFNYFFNKEMGNGFFIATQTTYRPKIYRHWYTELKAGIGWQRIYHPTNAYKFKNGNWEKTPGGKSQLIIPIGLSIGYGCSGKTPLSLFITYQIIPALFYNDTVPLNFYSLIQLGIYIPLTFKHQQ